MEVGPLARILAGIPGCTKHQAEGRGGRGAQDAGPDDGELESVMGRHLARGVECKLVADRCGEWLDQLKPDAPAFKDFSIPDSGRGYGLTEAARGALGHWLEIKGKKISNYQCVVPTTWNCSPRDDRGVPGRWNKRWSACPWRTRKIRWKLRASCARLIRVWLAPCIEHKRL